MHNFVDLHRVVLADAHEYELWKTPWADSAMFMITGKFILKMDRKSFTDALPM